MIVCVCNAIREHQVRDAARDGATTVCQVHQSLGCRAKCGQCAIVARAIIDDARAAA